jgi:hypothetical protein
MASIQVYSFSFNNPERKARMTERFNTVGHPVQWVAPVPITDPRIREDDDKRCQAIMYNHLDMIAAFLASSADYGVFCEDDIFIRRDFATSLRIAIDGYKRLQADVMLLGYLLNYKAFNYSIIEYHSLLEQPFAFLSVYSELWGSQMYLCGRTQALRIWEACCSPSLINGPFSPDWTLTKYGKAVAIYPMLAVEEGVVATEHEGQRDFHHWCLAENYDKDLHI